MSSSVPTKAVHHMTLTVTNLRRSCDFYTSLLGFQMAMELSPTRYLLSNGSLVLALTLPSEPEKAPADDMFNENRVGLDHVSLSVDSLEVLKEAAALFDQQGVSHGEIKDLGGLGLYVMAFRDPDNIQLELAAPHSV